MLFKSKKKKSVIGKSLGKGISIFLSFFFVNSIQLIAQCGIGSNFITNGDFESSTGSSDAFNNTAGTGWSNVTGSPDLWVSPMPTTNSGEWGGLADGTPSSPDGGNFTAVGNWSTNGESFSQTFMGTTPGETYVISCYYTNAGIEGITTIGSDDVGLDFTVSGIGVVGTTPLVPYLGEGNQVWFSYSTTFVATATFHTIEIGNVWTNSPTIATASSDYAYAGLDGFTVKLSLAEPSLSSTTLTNSCPSLSADLNSLITSSTPSGTSLVWSTDNDASDGLSMSGNAEDVDNDGDVDDPTTVEVAGTYYAYYFNSTDNCYTSASTGVVFTTTACCAAGNDAPILIKN